MGAETCQVSQIKTVDTDSYNAIQVSFAEQSLSKITKPQLGHLKKSGTKGFKYSGEFQIDDPNSYKLGQMLDVNVFSTGSTPGRVYPGKKMAGQLGNKMITIKNSEILFISAPENILVLKGSLPGKKDNLLRIAPVD